MILNDLNFNDITHRMRDFLTTLYLLKNKIKLVRYHKIKNKS